MSANIVFYNADLTDAKFAEASLATVGDGAESTTTRLNGANLEKTSRDGRAARLIRRPADEAGRPLATKGGALGKGFRRKDDLIGAKLEKASLAWDDAADIVFSYNA